MSAKRHFSYRVDYACVKIENKKLLSEVTHDIYFNPEDPIGESIHNFLIPNRLSERFQEDRSVSIAELGFGAGLNFLLTLRMWAEERRPGALHYISFEKNPVAWNDLNHFYQSLPELMEYIHLLEFDRVSLHPGINTIFLKELNATLILIIGEVNEWLSQMNFKADVWYLDGFAPSLNPDMWSTAIIKEISSHSATSTSLSSFSVNGNLRRELVNSGWNVQKLKGYKNKREMLTAIFSGTSDVLEKTPGDATDNFPAKKLNPKKKIAIIGAGIAGCSLAYYLSEHSHDVTIFDDRTSMLNHASDNPLALIMPELSRQADARSLLLMNAMSFLQRSFKSLNIYDSIFIPSGVIRFPTSERLKLLIEELPSFGIPDPIARAISPSETSKRLGFETRHSSLFFEESGFIEPRSLCRKYLELCNQTVISKVVSQIKPSRNSWVLFDRFGSEIGAFDVVVLASGVGSADLCSDLVSIPFTKNFGQILSFESEAKISNLPICFQGYLIGNENRYCLGATYEHAEVKLSFEETKKELFNKLENVIGESNIAKIKPANLEIKGAYRANTPDRLPYSGSLENGNSSVNLNGLFLHTNFGSRGFTLAPLLSSQLACQLSNKMDILDRKLISAINPLRFIR